MLGDQIKTGADGKAALKMRDGITFNIRSNSLVPINARLLREAPVATVLFVHGKVEIISTDQLYRQTIKGGKVYQGDVITTSAASSLQLDMIDGGYFAIRPDSKVEINDYVYQQKETDKVNATLLRGGLRSITGAIGQTNKKNFKLRTPVATIGIRGTDLDMFYLSEADAALKTAQTGTITPSGSYLKVNSGEAELASRAGVQAVKPNEIAFIAEANQQPALIDEEATPAVFEQETYEETIPGKNAPEETPKAAPEPAQTETQSRFHFSGFVSAGLARAHPFYNIDLLNPAISRATLPLSYRAVESDQSPQVSGVLQASGEVHYQPSAATDFYLGLDINKRGIGSDDDITSDRIKLGTRFNIGEPVTLSAEFSRLFADSDDSPLINDTDYGAYYQQAKAGYETEQLIAQLDVMLSQNVTLFTGLHFSKIYWEAQFSYFDSDNGAVYSNNYRNERELNLFELGARYQISNAVALSASAVTGEAISPSYYDGSRYEYKQSLSGLKLMAERQLSKLYLFGLLETYQVEDTTQIATLGGQFNLQDNLKLEAASRFIQHAAKGDNTNLTEAALRYQF